MAGLFILGKELIHCRSKAILLGIQFSIENVLKLNKKLFLSILRRPKLTGSDIIFILLFITAGIR